MNLKRRGFSVERLEEFESLCHKNDIEVVAGITKLNRKPDGNDKHKVSMSDGPFASPLFRDRVKAHKNRDKLRDELDLKKLVFPLIEIRGDNVLVDPEDLINNPKLMLQIGGEGVDLRSSEFRKEFAKFLGDAIILTKSAANEGVGCALHTADCGVMLIATKSNGGAIACVHSGWEGTRLDIVTKTLKRLKAKREETFVYIGPIACGNCYEFGKDLYEKEFQSQKKHKEWIKEHPSDSQKVLFDNRMAIADQLLDYGIDPKNIVQDTTCTMESDEFFSYRRDGFKGYSSFAVAIGFPNE